MLKPIQVVFEQVLLLLLPAHQTWGAAAGAGQVPEAGVPVQLFCAKGTRLLTTIKRNVSAKGLLFMLHLIRTKFVN